MGAKLPPRPVRVFQEFAVQMAPNQSAMEDGRACGKVDNNLEWNSQARKRPESASPTKINNGNIFHLFLLRSRSKAFSALTTISTSFPKAAMRTAWPSPSHGSAITIATRLAT